MSQIQASGSDERDGEERRRKLYLKRLARRWWALLILAIAAFVLGVAGIRMVFTSPLSGDGARAAIVGSAGVILLLIAIGLVVTLRQASRVRSSIRDLDQQPM